MDEIMNFRFALVSILISIMPQLSAHYSITQHEQPSEFLDSLSIGNKKITISVPRKLQLIDHETIANKQILSFIPDNQTLNNWNQHVSISITQNTNETAGQKVESIKQYLLNNYPESNVISISVKRERSGVQKAELSMQFTDEQGEVVLKSTYYSDESHLIGSEVSQRVTKAFKRALATAEKTNRKLIELN